MLNLTFQQQPQNTVTMVKPAKKQHAQICAYLPKMHRSMHMYKKGLGAAISFPDWKKIIL